MLTISLINLESKLLLAGSDTAAWGSHASLARIFFQEIIRSFYATIVIPLPPYLRDKRVKIASGQFSNENQPFMHYLISFPNLFNQFYFCSKSKLKIFIHFFFIPVSGLVSKSTREMAQEGESARKGYEFHACGAEW